MFSETRQSLCFQDLMKPSTASIRLHCGIVCCGIVYLVSMCQPSKNCTVKQFTTRSGYLSLFPGCFTSLVILNFSTGGVLKNASSGLVSDEIELFSKNRILTLITSMILP